MQTDEFSPGFTSTELHIYNEVSIFFRKTSNVSDSDYKLRILTMVPREELLLNPLEEQGPFTWLLYHSMALFLMRVVQYSGTV